MALLARLDDQPAAAAAGTVEDACLFTRFAFDVETGGGDDAGSGGGGEPAAVVAAVPSPRCVAAPSADWGATDESYGASDDDGFDAGIGGLDTSIMTYIAHSGVRYLPPDPEHEVPGPGVCSSAHSAGEGGHAACVDSDVRAAADMFTRFAMESSMAVAAAGPLDEVMMEASSEDDGMDDGAGLGGLDTNILSYTKPQQPALSAASAAKPADPEPARESSAGADPGASLFTRFAFDVDDDHNAAAAAATGDDDDDAEPAFFAQHSDLQELLAADAPAARPRDAAAAGDDAPFLFARFAFDEVAAADGTAEAKGERTVSAAPDAAEDDDAETDEAMPPFVFARFAFENDGDGDCEGGDGTEDSDRERETGVDVATKVVSVPDPAGAGVKDAGVEEAEEPTFAFASFAMDVASGEKDATPDIAATAPGAAAAAPADAAEPAAADDHPFVFARFAFDEAEQVEKEIAAAAAAASEPSLFTRFAFEARGEGDGGAAVAATDIATAPAPAALHTAGDANMSGLFTCFAFQVAEEDPAPPVAADDDRSLSLPSPTNRRRRSAARAFAGDAPPSPGGEMQSSMSDVSTHSLSIDGSLPEPMLGGGRTPLTMLSNSPPVEGVSPTQSPTSRPLDLSNRGLASVRSCVMSPCPLEPFAQHSERLRAVFEARVADAGPDAPPPTVANVRAWAAALLHDPEHGGGRVVPVSDTVFLADKLVLKATNRLEAELLARLGAKATMHVAQVPTLYAQYPAGAVFETPPQGCNTAVLYYKREGHVAADLAETLMRQYVASAADGGAPDAGILEGLKKVLNAAAAATVDLYNNGIVHQDLWLGNLVVGNVDVERAHYDAATVCFIDVVDCAAAGSEAFTASLGGLAVSTLGILLGVLMYGAPIAFTPKALWGDKPQPWWIHTHWTAPQVVTDKAKVAMTDAVLRMLLSLDHMQPVMQVGLVAHAERFLGPRHPVAKGAQQTLPGKWKYMSVKRAALAAAMVTQESLATCMLSVRGAGFWTLLRQELGKALTDDLYRAVSRKVQPLVKAHCPGILTPSTPPSRICTGFLPTSVGAHIRQPKDAPADGLPLDARHDQETNPPPSLGKVREVLQCDQISNFLTVEQMMLCGEVSEESSIRINKWGRVYGMTFEYEDFTEI